MKAIAHGVIVVMVTLALWGVACKAKAGTIRDLAKLINENVDVVIHQGTCKVDNKGKLTTVPAEAKEEIPCEAGIGNGDPTVHFVLLYRNGKPDRLIRFEVNTKQQEVIWNNGTEV